MMNAQKLQSSQGNRHSTETLKKVQSRIRILSQNLEFAKRENSSKDTLKKLEAELLKLETLASQKAKIIASQKEAFDKLKIDIINDPLFVLMKNGVEDGFEPLHYIAACSWRDLQQVKGVRAQKYDTYYVPLSHKRKHIRDYSGQISSNATKCVKPSKAEAGGYVEAVAVDNARFRVLLDDVFRRACEAEGFDNWAIEAAKTVILQGVSISKSCENVKINKNKKSKIVKNAIFYGISAIYINFPRIRRGEFLAA